MKHQLSISALSLLVLPVLVTAQDAASPEQAAAQNLVPIESLIQEVSRARDEEFVIDPRIRGIQAYTPREPVDYESLLGILRVAGLVAIEAGDQIHIVPDENMRVSAMRILQDDDRSVSDHEVVTRVISVPQVSRAVRNREGESYTETLQATQLVPILRPMMSRAAQLGAVPNSNTLIIVDRYDNVRRITAVIEEVVASFDD